VLANPWRKTETAGKIVQRELQPYAAADLGFIHEDQRPYASADHISPPCWAAVIPQDPTREPDLTPDSPRPRISKSGKVLQRHLIFVRHFGNFLLHSLCYRTRSDLARKDESTGSRQVFFFCHFSHRGYFLTLFRFIPRKGREEEGPRGPSVDTDGVVD
jgi:hypothetical protein